MDRKTQTRLIALLALVAAVAAPSSAEALRYRVRLRLDGRDDLVVVGNQLYLHHREGGLPWTGGPNGESVRVSCDVDGKAVETDRTWQPKWPGLGGGILPDPLVTDRLALPAALPRRTASAAVAVTEGRAQAKVVQWPDAGNGFALRVALSDPQPGSAVSEIEITVGDQRKRAVAVLVERDLAPSIAKAVGQYADDLMDEGWSPEQYTVPASAAPTAIRMLLRHVWDTTHHELEGVVLIGNLRAAYYECKTGDYSNPQRLDITISLDATDQYYMDLDGEYESFDHAPLFAGKPDSIVKANTHSNVAALDGEYIVAPKGTGWWHDVPREARAAFDPEIWCARIMAHNLDLPGQDEATVINRYFAWNHALRSRTGTHRSLLAGSGGTNTQGMDFTEIFGTNLLRARCSVTDITDSLTEHAGYELVYLSAHGWPGGSAWEGGGLDCAKLLAADKRGVFYILNSCSSARWDDYKLAKARRNYYGGMFVFAKTHPGGDLGLGAVGTTGVGGFNNLGAFADALRDDVGATYGDAWLRWYRHNLRPNFGLANYVFLGDPTIRPNRRIPRT